MSGFNVNKIAECPDWLAEMVQPSVKPKAQKASANDEVMLTVVDGTKINEGSRNASLFKQACRLRNTGMSIEAAKRALDDINNEQCAVPLDVTELFSVLQSAYGYNNDTPRHELTEFGNVNRMMSLYGDDLRYVPESKSFLHWDEQHWKHDESMRVDRMIKNMIMTIKQEAERAGSNGDSEVAKDLYRHAQHSQRKGHVDAVKTLLQSEVVINQSRLDANDYLLGVKNGVVDLKLGQLIKAERKQHIAKQANVSFDSSAACPLWLKFLDEIMCGDVDLHLKLTQDLHLILTHPGRQIMA